MPESLKGTKMGTYPFMTLNKIHGHNTVRLMRSPHMVHLLGNSLLLLLYLPVLKKLIFNLNLLNTAILLKVQQNSHNLDPCPYYSFTYCGTYNLSK